MSLGQARRAATSAFDTASGPVSGGMGAGMSAVMTMVGAEAPPADSEGAEAVAEEPAPPRERLA
eukprot:6561788-Prymnesium_polylepis.1